MSAVRASLICLLIPQPLGVTHPLKVPYMLGSNTQTMRITVLLILSFSFTLFTSTKGASDPVLDTTGKKLLYGVDYYILPVIRGRGGGVTMGQRNENTTCPLDVIQEQHEVSNGLPLRFSPLEPAKGETVITATDLNIKFSAMTVCVQSTVWKLGGYDESTKQWFVTTGGVEGNPGRQTVSNWFKIEKYEDDYKLVFCPTVCSFCKVLCRDIGVYVEEGTGARRLALSDLPFKVMFKKA